MALYRVPQCTPMGRKVSDERHDTEHGRQHWKIGPHTRRATNSSAGGGNLAVYPDRCDHPVLGGDGNDTVSGRQ